MHNEECIMHSGGGGRIYGYKKRGCRRLSDILLKERIKRFFARRVRKRDLQGGLAISKEEKGVGGEDILGCGEQVGRSGLRYTGESFFPSGGYIVIQHRFSHRQSVILLILSGYSHLSSQLNKRITEGRIGERFAAQVRQLLLGEVEAALEILGFASKIDTPIARIREGSIGRFDRIDQSARLTQAEIEPRIEAAAT